MTSISSVNYKDSYFEHMVLTIIRREPTYDTLHHLKNELKANVISVPTTLGGGNHGYLGMFLTQAEYPLHLRILSADRGLRQRISSPCSNGHTSACGHLQDLQTGWKTKSCLKSGGRIHTSNQALDWRIPELGPSVYSINSGASRRSRSWSTSGLYHLQYQSTCSRRSHHCIILLLPANWIIQQAAYGPKKWPDGAWNPYQNIPCNGHSLLEWG